MQTGRTAIEVSSDSVFAGTRILVTATESPAFQGEDSAYHDHVRMSFFITGDGFLICTWDGCLSQQQQQNGNIGASLPTLASEFTRAPQQCLRQGHR